MLILDNREIKLLELIKSNPNYTIPYVVENLQIGDIIIKHTVANTPEKTYNIILERKCITDMIASIKDGRYKEQKLRLQAEIAKNNSTTETIICYILEGSQNDLRLPQDKTMLNGSIISSIFRDKVPIIRTYTLQETLDIISRIHERLIKDCRDFFPQQPLYIPATPISSNEILQQQHNQIQTQNQQQTLNQPQNNLYLASIKKCKKDNITPMVWNQMCYMNIPGISSQIAIKIAEYYPTIKELLEAYAKCTTDGEKHLLLAEIVLTETDKQKRRIGGVISKRVYEFIMQ